MKEQLTIVSRESKLAMWQATHVAEQIRAKYPNLEVVINGVTTEGDQRLDQTLSKIGGKGLFVKELEKQLYEHKADLAVHSLKDVPQTLPTGLTLATILKRENPFDALISRAQLPLEELPAKSIIGTSSLRRQCQILNLRPDCLVKPVRGNVQTRLKKMESGEFEAIILATAGLKRLGMAERIVQTFSESEIIPAVGQGALAIECRSDDKWLLQILKSLNDKKTYDCIRAERAMNVELNGSCQSPIAGYATLNDGKLRLTGLVGEPDGQLLLKATAHGARKDAEKIGAQVAAALLAQGAGKIIERLSL